MLNVHLEVSAPLLTFGGVASWKVRDSAARRIPVAALASKSLTAVGAVVAAGSVTGKPIALDGSGQPPAVAAADPDVTAVAVVGSVSAPALTIVEVPVIFRCQSPWHRCGERGGKRRVGLTHHGRLPLEPTAAARKLRRGGKRFAKAPGTTPEASDDQVSRRRIRTAAIRIDAAA